MTRSGKPQRIGIGHRARGSPYCEPDACPIRQKDAGSFYLKNQMNILSYVDGNIDLIEIVEKSKVHWEEAIQIVKNLEKNGLIHKSGKKLNFIRFKGFKFFKSF
jgi:predicted methyltransferase